MAMEKQNELKLDASHLDIINDVDIDVLINGKDEGLVYTLNNQNVAIMIYMYFPNSILQLMLCYIISPIHRN